MAEIFEKPMRELLLSVPIVEETARGVAQSQLEELKKGLFENLRSHPVSREIENGPNADTSFLPEGYGNLFSFLGFDRGERPIEKLIMFLDEKIRIKENSRVLVGTRNGGSVKIFDEYIYTVDLPTPQDLDQATGMPWAGGRGWVGMVENGVNNFAFYMFLRGRTTPGSRSGTGIQIKNKLRGGMFTGTSYLSDIIQNFIGDFPPITTIGSIRRYASFFV